MEQALQKTWAGKTRSRGCPLCENAAWIYGALLWVNVQLVESLWLRNKEAGKADTVMGCCYRPCGYGEEMDGDLFKLKGISGHTTWWGVLENLVGFSMGNLILLDGQLWNTTIWWFLIILRGYFSVQGVDGADQVSQASVLGQSVQGRPSSSSRAFTERLNQCPLWQGSKT